METGKVYRNINSNALYRCEEVMLLNKLSNRSGYLMQNYYRPHNHIFVPDSEAYQWVDDSLGTRLKYARECRGWSQRELASKCDVSNASISRWETNEKEPTASSIIKLCTALEISSDRLLGLDILNERKEKINGQVDRC